MSYWSKLSMKDRANVMKLFLDKGISDLDTMRREYNLFAEGGDTSYSYTKPLDNVYIDSEGNVLDPSVPSAKGTIRIPDVVIATRDPRKAVPSANSLNTSNIESTVKEAIKNYFVGNLSDDEVRRRLYHNLAPYGYTHTIARLESAIKNNTSHEFDRRHKNDRDRQDIWAEYLGIPEEERKALFDSSTSILRDSQYSPTVGKEQNIEYKAISNPSEADVRDLIQHAEVLPIGKNKVVAGGIGHALGRYTIGHNYDNKGEYVSYYDKWDLNPFSNAGEDLSLGIGKPVNIYDRIYLDDYYGLPEEYRGSTYIPELTVTANKHANGGKIHIKPSHRGRLTELKKRTEKSEAELYKTGGPAVRKMITFARNARKWKHGLGGNLFDGGGSYSYTKPLDNVYVDSEGNLLDPSVPSARGTIQLPDIIVSTRDPRKPVPTTNYLNSSNIKNFAKETIKNALLSYAFGDNSKQIIQRRLYDNISPYSYTNALYRVHNAVVNNKKEKYKDYTEDPRDDIFAEYLQIPKEQRHNTGLNYWKLNPAKYKPSLSKNNADYFSLSLPKEVIEDLYNDVYFGTNVRNSDGLSLNENTVSETIDPLGRHTIGRGYDSEGEYMSYYDSWDLTPYGKSFKDQSFGIGKPVNIYDRIYLDDYFGMPKEYRGSTYIPEVTVTANKHADGGKIHIDPSKKGTFTAAASRHGMGVQEFASKVLANKENYSPAMVKKANFARNASKWHGFGGNLYDGTSEDSQQMTRPNIFQRPDGSYFYSADGVETDVSPINVLGDNPAQWTYSDASGKIYRPVQALPNNYTLTETEDATPLERAANNYFRELDWRAKNDPSSIALQGKYTMPLVLSPMLGKAAATALANPYVDAAFTSGFGAHGLNHAINEGINGIGDAAMTALEIVPLGRLAKPVYEGVVQPGMRLFNSPLTGNWTKIGNREYRLNPNSLGANGSPIESRGIAPQITTENAASMTPEQWTAAQDAAIARGDMAEAQRLRDLHFKVNAPNTTIVNELDDPIHNYHGTTSTFTAFDPQKVGLTTGDKSGFFFTDNKKVANFYSHETGSAWNNLKLMLGLYKGHKPQIYDVYLNTTKPMITDFHGGVDEVGREILAKEAIKNGNDANILQNIIDGPPALPHNVTIMRNPKHIKLADAVTYDDNGVRIPLGLRDNFKINDIRYGLLPFLGLGAAGTLYGKQE